MLKVVRQVAASSSILVETAVLLAPLVDVVPFPLVGAALSHESNAHAGDENVEAVPASVSSVVDVLVEESTDLARLGAFEFDDETCA